MDKQELRTKVETAFGDVPYPGDEAIGSPTGRDDEASVTAWLRGRDWRSLKPGELWPPALYFITLQAFHYYLPAYLLAADSEEAGDVIDNVQFFLTPNHLQSDAVRRISSEQNAFLQERYDLLTSAQKKVISEFFNLWLEDWVVDLQEGGMAVDQHESKLRALRDYWKESEPT